MDPRLREDDTEKDISTQQNLPCGMKKLFGTFFLIIAGVVSAATAKAVNLTLQLPGGQTTGVVNPGATVASFYSFALLISGILAFGAIVWGGITYALAAGNPSKQSEGKEWIIGALLGILLLAGAYFILNIINPSLVNLTVPTLSPLQQAPAGNDSNGTPAGNNSGGTSAGGGTISPSTNNGSFWSGIKCAWENRNNCKF